MSQNTTPSKEPQAGDVMKYAVPLRSESPQPFVVDVKVLDVRKKFGRVDVKVTPVAGSGEAYVSNKNLKP